MESENGYFYPATDSTYVRCKGITIFQHVCAEAMKAIIIANPEMTPKDVAKLAINHAEALQKQWEKV